MKIITINVLVDVKDGEEQPAYDGLNAILRDYTSPLGSGVCDNSPLIIDYSLGNPKPVPLAIEKAVRDETYVEGSLGVWNYE